MLLNDFMEKTKFIEKFKKIMIIKNVISLILYIISTYTWIRNNDFPKPLKYTALISMVLYIIMFFVILFFSGNNFKKNLAQYKKQMKTMRSILKFFNLVILTVTTISLFTLTFENIVTLIINISIITINVLSFIFKLVMYRIKIKFKKLFNKNDKKEEKQSFLGFILNDDDISENDTFDSNINEENINQNNKN